jgi:hypothetical protein
MKNEVGAFPVWRPNLDELYVDSAPASAFLILKSFKIILLQLSCRVPAGVLAFLLSDGPVAEVAVASLRLAFHTPSGSTRTHQSSLALDTVPVGLSHERRGL